MAAREPAAAGQSGAGSGFEQQLGAGMQEEAELVGFPAVAGGAVRPGVELVLLDHVFHLAAGAVDTSVKDLGRAAQVGDDEADVGALRGGFDAGGDGSWPSPR